MLSKKTPPPQHGGRGDGCRCRQQAELVPAQPDSSTQQCPSTSWDKEKLDVFKAYNRYVLESLQDNFDLVMAIAEQVTAAEHERDIHQRCSHVGGGRHKQQ